MNSVLQNWEKNPKNILAKTQLSWNDPARSLMLLPSHSSGGHRHGATGEGHLVLMVNVIPIWEALPRVTGLYQLHIAAPARWLLGWLPAGCHISQADQDQALCHSWLKPPQQVLWYGQAAASLLEESPVVGKANFGGTLAIRIVSSFLLLVSAWLTFWHNKSVTVPKSPVDLNIILY